ncbi:MAG: UDP-N-acetylglucosamine 1-carboxyvinyltransferase [Chloroflexi bacterium]|jgi:UDP-N-acetylglucosamine 1-carboxyvinyltransferase|uniref:UDP-N-acetylglucosamine 1-carboxyvinyltransferase n=1 Tax=Candidatus Thermofonsia Clade 3 bacterium TaxID=2364212 RepID=A0A2M8QFH2_9CHLR|nr:UDP-N-acetylglucosamine 1-carboxyvinyltransferase [Candidatus Roseilinea sp. NK_OTU-006]PJF48539.1 MAG: UDP-N-acetylglucosamine 1-carboxyvinyltransferase [Candidatus Thermofonsia Clade 3 bacterium]RMG62171.1 MAG: UDP-N-acetylglucosamine 1-carboxyvinyltransferase [Chloroflexota bacterium]
MNSEFIIQGGVRLGGQVVASGNKNAALPLLAASLLTEEPLILHNVPRIRDVEIMARLLQTLGVSVEWIAPNSLRLQAADVNARALSRDLCREIRASILLAGPMLGRVGSINLPPPGGDVIGRRRLDTHFLAFNALGASISVNGEFQIRTSGLTGADILLDEASVTATENAIMAAALAKGVTVLRNAASEPHVQDLCRCVNRMGAHIEHIGSNTLVIHGCDRLGGAEFTLGADNIEVTSFIVIGALCADERGLWIRNADPQHLGMTRLVLRRLGIRFETHGADVFVPGSQRLVVEPEFDGYMPKIDDNPWPAFPADAISSAIVAATQAEGSVLFHEKMYESRLYWVDKLISMGARIVLCDPHRCVVQGPSRLRGERVQSPDIRAGVALVIAALCAEGESVIQNVQQIDRGYERFEEKLRAIGAQIERRPI